MSTVTFETLFKTTNKGLLTKYTESTLLSREFYSLSLGLQIIFMLIFMSYFGLSIFRSFKKIKNPKFKVEDPDQESSVTNDEDSDEEENEKNTNDQLIYRFDEDDHEKERKIEDVEDDFEPQQKQKEETEEQKQQQDDEYDNEHDEHEEAFLQIDHKVMFLQPFMIGHVISNNLFTCDAISISMLLGTVLFFIIFNIKGVCSKFKWLNLLFMIPGLLSFLPIFLNDHDMST